VEHFSRLILDLQYQVMQVRLVPLGQIFARFPRMVRDLAQAKKKKISFTISGSDLEMDRTIIDGLGEPLVHLLRNAVDHGVARQGLLDLSARRDKEFALISVTNEGRSIDWSGVVSAAARKKIITAEEARKISKRLTAPDRLPPEAKALLFDPRLSTKKRVTETSGRGVGLNVVKTFADKLGGQVLVESPLSVKGTGKKLKTKAGARFTLELPLSLAIINALLIAVRGFVMAVPFNSVQRVVRVPDKDVKSMADQDVAVVDGKDVPLVSLDQVFDLKDLLLSRLGTAVSPRPKEEGWRTVVLTARGEDLAGMVVDRVFDQQEIIVKTLPKVLQGLRGFSGSTILGDGRTVLILDVLGLLESTRKFTRV
jgi:two-component system chemotaxis sensor kinase CheA